MNIFVKSILLYLLFIVIAIGFRALFLALHFDEGYSLSAALKALISGLRFDMQFVGYFASVYYLFNLSRFRPLIIFTRILLIVIGAIFIAANAIFMVFYNIYGKNFDNQLFLFRNEKLGNLFDMLIGSNYGIWPAFALFVLVFALFVWVVLKIERFRLNFSFGRFYHCASFVVFALLMMLSINQQFYYKAKSIYNELRFTKFAAINASMPGHLKGFIGAIKDELITKEHKFSDFSALSPKEVACKMLDLSPCPDSFNLAQVARNHNAITPLKNRPQKIFYVISESLSDWINEPRFDALWGEFTHRKNLAYLPSIENANATARSLQTQFMGAYYNYTDNTHFANKLRFMPTNIITRAINAGYEVHFYFGGANNWAELFDFFKALDKRIILHDKDDAIEWALANGYKKPLANGWGAFDDVLFDYARANAAPNTFNIFMTVTNHPAYDLAWLVRKVGESSWDKIDALSKKYRNELATVQWYLRVLNRWLDGAKNGELYFITGDHYGRYNIDDNHDALLTHSVPVYAYSKDEQLYTAAPDCSHLSIAASIFALIGKDDDVTLAPACFSAAKNAIRPKLNFYGYEFSLLDDKLLPTPKEAAALGWYLAYEGSHFE